MDNLNIHSYYVILQNLEFNEAVEIIRKISFHKTPKHASWLNMAEIEINIINTRCTGRRIPNK